MTRPPVRYAVTADCTACGACLRTCPVAALRPTGDRIAPLAVLATRCNDCGACLEVCPADAVVRA